MSGNLYHGSPLEKFQIFQFCKLSKFVKSTKLDFENAKKTEFLVGQSKIVVVIKTKQVKCSYPQYFFLKIDLEDDKHWAYFDSSCLL